MMLTIKNRGGPTLVHTVRGARHLEPGATVTAEFEDAQGEAYRGAGNLEVTDASGDEAEDEPKVLTLAEQAAALGIEVDKRWGEARLRKEIEKATKT